MVPVGKSRAASAISVTGVVGACTSGGGSSGVIKLRATKTMPTTIIAVAMSNIVLRGSIEPSYPGSKIGLIIIPNVANPPVAIAMP